MKVWIFQTGEPLHTDEGNPRSMRAMNLADALVAAGHSVTIWSSAFYHQETRYRASEYQCINISSSLEVRLIPSPGYVRNIGLGRLFDHLLLAWNLKQILKNDGGIPDVAFIGFPPIEFAYSAVRYLNGKGIPYMLDAKDMWPDYFVEKIPSQLRFMGRVIFYPWFLLTEYSFKHAAAFSTISNGYLSWMYRVSRRDSNPLDIVAPTSTTYKNEAFADNADIITTWAKNGVLIGQHKIFYYAGTINKTLDFDSLVYTAKKLADIECQFRLVICGDGPEKENLQQQFNGLNNVVFTGWVNKDMLYVLAKNALASLIPYRNSETFAMGIPNKLSDALSIGVPVISCLGGEVNRLINDNEIGFCYDHDKSEQLLARCLNYLNNPKLFLNYSKKAKQIYKTRFDFEVIYGALVKNMNELGKMQK